MIGVSGEIETGGPGDGGERRGRTGETREAPGSERRRGRAAGESPGGAEMRSDVIGRETDLGETAETERETKTT